MNNYQQEWQLSEKDRKTYELARRYHDEAEAYDRTVCTGPICNGSILPVGAWERAQINRNAHKLRREIMEEAANHGISTAKMDRAISRMGQ